MQTPDVRGRDRPAMPATTIAIRSVQIGSAIAAASVRDNGFRIGRRGRPLFAPMRTTFPDAAVNQKLGREVSSGVSLLSW